MGASRTPFKQWETDKRMDKRVNRLMKHIMNDGSNELMSASQVTPTLELLKKYRPDLQSIEGTANPDHLSNIMP